MSPEPKRHILDRGARKLVLQRAALFLPQIRKAPWVERVRLRVEFIVRVHGHRRSDEDCTFGYHSAVGELKVLHRAAHDRDCIDNHELWRLHI